MKTQSRVAVGAALVAALGVVQRRPLAAGVQLGVRRWRHDPVATAIDIGASSTGQMFFWTIGMDQIGIGMNPKWQPGYGHHLVSKLRLPDSATMAWAIKIVEILSDASKMPFEGKLYAELGIVPDAVAAGFTQPLWSYIEVAEKVLSVAVYPERVNTPEQIQNSLACIYGTWTRHGLSLLFLVFGGKLRGKLTHPQTIIQSYK